MDNEIPKWLNKQFIIEVIQGGPDVTKEDEVTVVDMDVDKPIPKGENYVCEIFRVKTVYRKSNKENEDMKTTFIVKSPITGGLHDLLLKLGMPQKEVRYYKEYIPRMERVMQGKSLSPKSYYSSQENVLVLEDLKSKGYMMANRRLRLDYDHCVVALKTLATFHACSVKLHEEDPEFVESIAHEVFYVDGFRATNEIFGKINFLLMAEECKKHPELERYAEQLAGFGENAWDILMEITKPKENSLNVFNHGDFWVNNMLFRFENNKPVDLKLIDFQISRYTSPAVDLLYFLYASVQEDVLIKRKNDLLHVYVTQLNSSLKEFGSSESLTQAEVEKMIDENEFFGILVSLSIFPIITSDPSEGVMDIKDATEDMMTDLEKSPFKMFYKNKTFLDVMKKRLAEFEKKGWF